MAKIKLNKIDKTRLSELVDTYLKIESEYKIEDNGGVTAKIKGKRFRWIFGIGESRDFHELTLNIIKVIMEQKATIPDAQIFCSDAMGAMMTSNDRKSVIKSLYMAHLVEPQDEYSDDESHQKSKKQRRKLETIEVEVETEQRYSRDKPIRVLQGISAGDQLARLLNNSDIIVMRD